jgi:hypothetical protein
MSERIKLAMEIGKAIKIMRGGILLDIEVKPNSPKSIFPSSYDEWRNRFRATTVSPPERGKANEEIIRLIANFFAINKKRVSISFGKKSRNKTIFLKGIDENDAIEKLERKVKENKEK